MLLAAKDHKDDIQVIIDNDYNIRCKELGYNRNSIYFKVQQEFIINTMELYTRHYINKSSRDHAISKILNDLADHCQRHGSSKKHEFTIYEFVLSGSNSDEASDINLNIEPMLNTGGKVHGETCECQQKCV